MWACVIYDSATCIAANKGKAVGNNGQDPSNVQFALWTQIYWMQRHTVLFV